MPKILFADDSITVRKVAERLLTDAGLQVVLAANAEEALARLTKEPPDLIISDVIMPDKSGYDLCAAVRSHGTLCDTPVLLISGVVNEDVIREAECCRADGVLKKPFQGSALQDRVLELLGKQQPRLSPAAAPPPAVPPASGPTQPSGGSKAYRITEEQLHTFRQAAARIRELEGLLAQEKEHAAKASQTVVQADGVDARVGELEGLLAHERDRSGHLQGRIEELERAATRVGELEASLAESKERAGKLAQRLAQAEDADARVSKLESLLTEEGQRLAQWRARTEELTRVLAEIARLAAQAGTSETTGASE